MRIRTKLTILFAIFVAVILLLFSIVVYIASSEDREQLFRNRLYESSRNTASLLLDVEEIDSELLKIIEKNRIALPEEVISIFTADHERIYTTPEVGVPVYDPVLLERIKTEREISIYHGKKELIGYIIDTGPADFIIIGEAYDKYGFIKLSNLRNILILSFFVSILLIVIAGWFYSGQALRPISKVVDEVGQISASRLDTRLDTGNNTDEIALLSLTFNKMLERLESAFAMQRTFVANASHELRTPLTAITGQIEVSLMKERSSEEYRQILMSILDDIKDMNRLSHGLLELAQASLDISQLRLWPCRLDEILWQSRAELLKIMPQANVMLRFGELPEDENALTINGNAQLLKSCFINLMENGCKFSDNHSVIVSLSIVSKRIEIRFENDGPGIQPHDVQKIFQPFVRGSNANSIRGHGLGLSMAKKIVELHQGQMSLESDPGSLTVVKVRLPVIGSASVL